MNVIHNVLIHFSVTNRPIVMKVWGVIEGNPGMVCVGFFGGGGLPG